MTATELVRTFQREIHQKDDVPAVDTSDVEHYLNKAQENFIKDKFAGKRTSVQGFEESQDLVDDLRTLFEKDVRATTIYAGAQARASGINVDQAFLPDNYLHLVSPRAGVQVSTEFSGGTRDDFDWNKSQTTIDGQNYDKRVADATQNYDERIVPVSVTQSQRVLSHLRDPFHRPSYNRPLCDLNNDRLNVYTTSEFIIDFVLFNYIRSPNTITMEGGGKTSELPEELHREIVDRAVRLFLRRRPRRSNPNQQDE